MTSNGSRGGAGPLDETWSHSNSNIPDYCYLVKLYLLFIGLLFTIYYFMIYRLASGCQAKNTPMVHFLS